MASIGNEVRDGFKATDNWLSVNIEFLSDIEQFYRQRSIIEKEYATQLQKLSAEYLKKKANKTTSLSVGDEPLITPGSLESSTVTTWGEILSNTEMQATNHAQFSKELSFKVADVVNQIQGRCSSVQRSIETVYNDQMTVARDDFFKGVEKGKKYYDETCQAMESVRVKNEKRDSSKLQGKLKEKETDMNIAKNDYLIRINVANRVKDKFYFQDLPELLDLFQDVNEFKTKNLNRTLEIASTLEINLASKTIAIQNGSIEVVKANLPPLDTEMFIKHNSNAATWKEPQDFYYIPSSIWHDDEQLITTETELNELKKIMIKSKATLANNDDALEARREELNALSQRKKAAKGDNTDTDFKSDTELLHTYLKTLSKFVSLENKKVESQVEIETISNNVDLSHDLSLDGLSIQRKKTGFFSKLRGVKHRDESKIVNVYDDVQSIKTATSNHTTSSGFRLGGLLRSKSVKSNHNDTDSITSGQRSFSATGGGGAGPTSHSGTAMYPYAAQGDDEVSISAQETFGVLQMDDGSGWTLIYKSDGSQGLVPTSYIQIAAGSTVAIPKKKGPEVKPRKGAAKIQYCIVRFDYQMEEPGELSISEGEKLIVVKGDEDGWTVGENSNGKRGMFPSSYVELV